ncbi:putative secreted protein (Por secretion system target) [Ulvibacter sp. MAR_2010_11]|uniref:T9SS type A sorting domain-containing protein n=1 Tax=Ulvibacter sp. MAR_2010_11 TaxID=1250229 RepID=UPI000C2C8D48|nr:T9SS type A sorting domain-containing protein [Ulvibacter sp. MAR_2010_11]PKA83821.1 putative secreted protein (Por secretion system target) [Ulvibacter sp. MAR_2010_11]
MRNRIAIFSLFLFCFTTIKAQFSETEKIVSGNREDRAEYGTGVDIMDGYAIVGAPRETFASGAAYIYEKNGAGEWQLLQTLTAFDPNFGAEYGGTVKISEERVIVSAGRADVDGIFRTGAIYIYENDGSNSWEYTHKIVASDYAQDDKLGMNHTTLDFQGDTIVCGAPGDDNWTGSFYIFEKEGGNWIEKQKVLSPNPSAFDVFGIGVAIYGDYIIAGASEEDGLRGAAHIYKKDSNGDWSHIQKISASDGQPQDYFGNSLAFEGEILVVGAYGSNAYSGSAYIFEMDSNGVWNEVQKIEGTAPIPNAHYSYSMELEGDYLAVGSPHVGTTELGEVHFYKRNSSGVWEMIQHIQATDIALDDYFGWCLALTNNQLIVGAPFEDHDENGENEIDRAGSAYIFQDPSILGGGEYIPVSNMFSLFPVPAINAVTLDSGSNTLSEFQIINELGIRIKQVQGDFTGKTPIDISSLAEGVYILKGTDTKGNSSTQKFIKLK